MGQVFWRTVRVLRFIIFSDTDLRRVFGIGGQMSSYYLMMYLKERVYIVSRYNYIPVVDDYPIIPGYHAPSATRINVKVFMKSSYKSWVYDTSTNWIHHPPPRIKRCDASLSVGKVHH